MEQEYVILKSGNYRDYHKKEGRPGQRGRGFQAGESISCPKEYGDYLINRGLACLKPLLPLPDSNDIEVVASNSDATDSARELAKENDVDLSKVTGTGSDGRILKNDVLDYIKAGE